MNSRIITRYYVVVTSTDEEIEVSDRVYEEMYSDFQSNKVPQQVVFRDIRGDKFMEQRHNLRMRTTRETIYE